MGETIYISDLIKALEEVKNNHGDIPIFGSFREPKEDIADLFSIEGEDDEEYLEIG